MEKITHLTSMVEFVKQFDYVEEDFENAFLSIMNYANFLSQPLTLSMFVPCDDEGNVLEETEWSEPLSVEEEEVFEHEQYLYEKAKSKVLFEGFEIETDMHHSTKREIIWLNKPINKVFLRLSFYNGDVKTTFMPDENIKTVEDLLRYNLTLTPTALKQIYG